MVGFVVFLAVPGPHEDCARDLAVYLALFGCEKVLGDVRGDVFSVGSIIEVLLDVVSFLLGKEKRGGIW